MNGLLPTLLLGGISSPSAYNCTKARCVFSFTNPPDKNGGRCGEVDAAPHMPADIWNDGPAITAYCVATQEFYDFRYPDGHGLALENKACERSSNWIQNESVTEPWITEGFFLEICNR